MPSLFSRTILVVDDEPDLLDLIAQILRMKGATVYTAKDGSEAFEIWSGTPQIEVIITDVSMPGIGADGISLVRKIRAVSPVKPPIIVITGFSMQTETDALAAGASLVLAKPFHAQDIDAAILKLLSIS